MKDAGAPEPRLAYVQPGDVVGFLHVCEQSGRTTVHALACHRFGREANTGELPPCACPKRAVFVALKNKKYAVQAMLREEVGSEPWCCRTRTGNPCASDRVDAFLAAVEREQCGAGVVSQQALLMDASVHRRIVSTVQEEWAAEAPGSLASVEKARDNLLYSLMWGTGFRAADALGLRVPQLRFVGASKEHPRAHVVVRVTSSKSVRAAGDAYEVTVLEDADPDGERYTLRTAWHLYLNALEKAGLDTAGTAGPLFRAFVEKEDGSVAAGPALECATAARSFGRTLTRAGLSAADIGRLTLHSYHGSRAARDKQAGVPPEETVRNMNWSMEMYLLYTSGRVMRSEEDLRADASQPKTAARPRPVSGGAPAGRKRGTR